MSWHVAYADRYDTRTADMAADVPFHVDGLGLIDEFGLELVALHGGFTREPLTDDRTEHVFVVRG